MSPAVTAPMPHVEGVSHQYVDAGGLRVHVAVAGPEDGEPVLLLHGWPQHWYLWRGLVPHLAKRYLMLMPDLRGSGWTEATDGGYEKDQLARDQVALLDALGIERVKLMGHDWGGYAGFLMCLLAPDRIERYVPCNIVHPWPSRNPRTLLDSWRLVYQLPMSLPLVGPRMAARPGFVKRVLNTGSPAGVFTPDELEAFEAPYRERPEPTAKIYRSFQAHDLWQLAGGHWTRYRLTTPTLMIYGTGDFAVRPSQLAGFERHADDMRIETIEGSGHFVVDAAPDRIAALTLEFFDAR